MCKMHARAVVCARVDGTRVWLPLFIRLSMQHTRVYGIYIHEKYIYLTYIYIHGYGYLYSHNHGDKYV